MFNYDEDPIPSHPSEFACIDLVNSSFSDYLGSGARTDRLGSPEWWQWFLDHHDLTPDTRDMPPLEETRELRLGLRRMLEKWARQTALNSRDLRALDDWISAVPLRKRVVRVAGGVELEHEPLRRDWSWVIAAIAESAVDLIAAADPKRLKICSNPDCSWIFYDTTVNRSRRYCSPTPCGSLIRVRRFRDHD